MRLTGLDLNMRQPRGVSETAVQRFGQDPADRPDLETVPVFVDVRGHQRRVGSSLAAKKAEAVVNISFARQFRVLRPQPPQLRHRLLRGLLRLRGGRRVRLVAPAPQ